MRMSRLYAPTLRDIPGEAETPSHQLMLQAAMIRRSASGTYTWLPLGLRVLHKVAAIVREEMGRAGAQEILMPVLQPAELWHRSGRWNDYGPELMRLSDRSHRWFALGPTHEELITNLVSGEMRSYRQLPLILFQIHGKYRDEIRPRFGVMRSREFLMKDAYSFDRDQQGLDASYEAMHRAYERIFARVGLDARPALADPGAIGGNATHEFVVPSAWGEARLVSCAACGYLANVEQAQAGIPVGDESAFKEEPKGVAGPFVKVRTPEMTTVAEVTAYLGAEARDLIKTLIVADPTGQLAAALVRGDHELSRAKLARALGVAGVEMAAAPEVVGATGAEVGFAGPVGLGGLRVIADPAVMAMGQAIAGANETDYHLTGVRPGRDFRPDLVADLREVAAGDPCPECGAPLAAGRGIEVGQIFKLGTKYSEVFGVRYATDDGTLVAAEMGCYGIGIGRTVATVIETHHDEQGIVWPVSVAPYQALVLLINDRDERQRAEAERLYGQLLDLGIEALIDDRPERAGVKFRDAELIGVPYRLAVGQRALADGQVELQVRASGESRRLELATAAAEVAAAVRGELERIGSGLS